MINTGTFVAYPCMALVITITLLLERTQKDFSGFVTPYNYSSPWGEKIAQKEIQFIEKFRAKRQSKKQLKEVPDYSKNHAD